MRETYFISVCTLGESPNLNRCLSALLEISAGTSENIKVAVDQIMGSLDRNNFIFNLGHGILPTTPVSNVEYLVNYVKSFK